MAPLPSSLRITFWNANGIARQINEVKDFITRLNIDIFLVNETHLRAGDNLRIPNYRTYRNDRKDKRGGGTAVLIKKDIPHYALPDLQLSQIEATQIAVQTKNGIVRMIAAYCPPSNRLTTGDLNTLFPITKGKGTSPPPTVLAGDLNAKHTEWNSCISNTKGNTLKRWAEDKEISILAPDGPTRFNSDGTGDILDIALTANLNWLHLLQTVPELNSDHNPVVMDIEGSDIHAIPQPAESISWKKFQEYINQNSFTPTDLDSTEKIDKAIENFTKLIIDAQKQATKTNHLGRSDFPQHIKELVKEKNRARRAWQNYCDPNQKAKMNKLQRVIKTELRIHHNQRWQDTIASLGIDDNSIWKMAKALKNKLHTDIPPMKSPNGTTITNPEEKLELFADAMANQFSPNPDDNPARTEEIEKNAEELIHIPTCNPEPPSKEDLHPIIVSHLANTNPGKASGPDKIRAKSLKALPMAGAETLTEICHAALELNYFPKAWKKADIILIRKPLKTGTAPDHYRPISIISNLGKVYERVILTHITAITESLGILPDVQHGFRPHHSTYHQLLRVVEFICDGFDRKETTCAAFLDIAKAFDKVWHAGLLTKLHQFGYPHNITRLIYSFLRERSFCVRIHDSKSSPRTMTAGVPQGSILSPHLFNIFTADIPTPTLPHTIIALYADDTAILARSRIPTFAARRVQKALDPISTWFKEWRIKTNPTKSEAIDFRHPPRRKPPAYKITLETAEIPWKKSLRYLGLILDRRLSWCPHIARTRQKADAALAILKPLLCKRSKLFPANKLLLFNTMILPIITYACPTWGYIPPSRYHSLQVIQNRVLRWILDAPWFIQNAQIYRDTGIPQIQETIRKYAETFYTDIQKISNPTIKTLLDYDLEECHYKPRPKSILAPI
jgi:retron-type reverse transcriptase/endonuclease/exonuclease/phosphatase family metal-dependent hydrolase